METGCKTAARQKITDGERIPNMNKIFVLMGKSATGKDTLYNELLKQSQLGLRPVVTYTTRPIRVGEADGREYYFVSEEQYEQMERAHRVIESRAYDTVHGVWRYFTAMDHQFEKAEPVLLINTLEGYEQIVQFFGQDRVIPLYVQVEDGERLSRALMRERQQKEPKYQELCRRFLADSEDFSEEKIVAAGITRRFENENWKVCLQELTAAIAEQLNRK